MEKNEKMYTIWSVNTAIQLLYVSTYVVLYGSTVINLKTSATAAVATRQNNLLLIILRRYHMRIIRYFNNSIILSL